MTKQQLKELLEEAFETGRQYQRRVHLYSGMYSDDPDSYFTKWYNSEVKGKNFQMTSNERLDALTEGIDDPHIENLIRMGR